MSKAPTKEYTLEGPIAPAVYVAEYGLIGCQWEERHLGPLKAQLPTYRHTSSGRGKGIEVFSVCVCEIQKGDNI